MDKAIKNITVASGNMKLLADSTDKFLGWRKEG